MIFHLAATIRKSTGRTTLIDLGLVRWGPTA